MLLKKRQIFGTVAWGRVLTCLSEAVMPARVIGMIGVTPPQARPAHKEEGKRVNSRRFTTIDGAGS
jgi:hypothetical protein